MQALFFMQIQNLTYDFWFFEFLLFLGRKSETNHNIVLRIERNLTPWSQKRWKVIKFETSSFRVSGLDWVWASEFLPEWPEFRPGRVSWKTVSNMCWGIWWKICFFSKVIASLIDGPLTSAKNYGRPNSSESEKLIRNKTILSLWALRVGLGFFIKFCPFWPHLTSFDIGVAKLTFHVYDPTCHPVYSNSNYLSGWNWWS